MIPVYPIPPDLYHQYTERTILHLQKSAPTVQAAEKTAKIKALSRFDGNQRDPFYRDEGKGYFLTKV